MSRRFRRRSLLASPAALAAARPVAPTRPRFTIHDDGSFDVTLPHLALRGAYPALDDVPLRPLGVAVQRSANGGRISFELSSRQRFSLELGADDDSAWMQATLEGFDAAPHWVYPLAGARVEGADRFFRQGLGFGGPSGLFPIPRAGFHHDANALTEQTWSYDSFLTAALVAPSLATLAVGAVDGRDYLQRTTFGNRSHRGELVDKRPASDDVVLAAGFATERIPLPGGRLTLPRLHLVGGDRTFDTLQAFARKLAAARGVRLRPTPRLHWDSWYEFFEGHDAVRLDDTLAGLRRTQPPIPFQGVLIDAGYAPAGEWLRADERLYPGGLEATFARIAAAGFAPGIWVCPWMVGSLAPVYRDHADWLLRGPDGKPLPHKKGQPFFNVFANYEERFYLDTSHPAAFAHVREIFRTYRRWGVKSYKLDFTEWGLHDSTKVRRHTPGKTSIQYLVDVLRMIRDEIGPDAYLLACIAPFAPLVGLADGMRVGYDVDTDTWRAGGNTLNMFQETQTTQYMNGVLWENDPDVLYVRDGTGTTRMNDDESVALALWDGMLGGVMSTSDRPHRLSRERLALLRFVQPGQSRNVASFPLWHEQNRKIRVAVRTYADRAAFGVLVVNTGEEPVSEALPLATIVGAREAFVYRWAPGRADRAGRRTTLEPKLGRHQAALYWVSAKDAPPPADLGLSGERVAGLPG